MTPIAAVARHGIRSWWKDRRAMMLGILTPIMLFLVFARILSGEKQGVPNLNVGWVDLDKSRSSLRLSTLLESDGVVHLVTQIQLPFEGKNIPLNQENVKGMLEEGKISTAILILPGFGDQVLYFRNWKTSFVKLFYEPAENMQAGIVKGLLTKASFLLASETSGDPAKVDPRMKRFASDLRRAFRESSELMRQKRESSIQESFIPVSVQEIKGGKRENPGAAQQLAGVAIMFLLFSVSRAGSIVLEEKQSGTLKRILSSPLSIQQLVLGKLFSISLNGILQISILCLVGWAAFHVPVFESPFALLAMIAATATCAASFGLVFSTFCQTSEQVLASATFLILTMSLVGGSMVPKFLLPLWTQRLSFLTLNGWAMDGFLTVLVRGKGLFYIWPQIVALCAMTSLFLTLAFSILPKKLYE